MIYTVTLNTSIDYYVSCGGFETGRTNRTKTTEMLPGGKGINVSVMLKRMGYESVALGFTGGFTGREIARLLEEAGIHTDFVELSDGTSRINVKIEDIEGTEINGAGPVIKQEEADLFWEKLDKLNEKDVLVLSGSVPAGMPDDTYEKIISRLAGKKVKIVVDAEGDLLVKALKYKPFLVKPNHHELEGIFHVPIEDFDSAEKYGRRLSEMGARNVIVTMAGMGAVYISEEGFVYRHGALEGNFVNGVGAGDSMIAGFLAGFMDSGDCKQAFLLGLSAASATAFSKGLGEENLIKNIYKKVLTTT